MKKKLDIHAYTCPVCLGEGSDIAHRGKCVVCQGKGVISPDKARGFLKYPRLRKSLEDQGLQYSEDSPEEREEMRRHIREIQRSYSSAIVLECPSTDGYHERHYIDCKRCGFHDGTGDMNTVVYCFLSA